MSKNASEKDTDKKSVEEELNDAALAKIVGGEDTTPNSNATQTGIVTGNDPEPSPMP